MKRYKQSKKKAPKEPRKKVNTLDSHYLKFYGLTKAEYDEYSCMLELENT